MEQHVNPYEHEIPSRAEIISLAFNDATVASAMQMHKHGLGFEEALRLAIVALVAQKQELIRQLEVARALQPVVYRIGGASLVFDPQAVGHAPEKGSGKPERDYERDA